MSRSSTFRYHIVSIKLLRACNYPSCASGASSYHMSSTVANRTHARTCLPPHSQRITTSWRLLRANAWRKCCRHTSSNGSMFATRRARAASCHARTWTLSRLHPRANRRARDRRRLVVGAHRRRSGLLARATRTLLRGTTSPRQSHCPLREHSSLRLSARPLVQSRAHRRLSLRPNGPLERREEIQRLRQRRQQQRTCTPTCPMWPEPPRP